MAGTSADKLNKLKQTKADIKAAIQEKGQAVSDDDTFASYADKIRAIDNDVVLQEKAAEPSILPQTISPDEGYDGLSKVTIEGMLLQEKTVYPTDSEQTVEPDRGFDGLSKVTVTKMKLQEKKVTQNGAVIADSGYDGLEKVTVAVEPELQNKSIDIIKNGRTEVIADSGFYGLEKVTIDVDVELNLQEKTVTENGEVVADDGYDGLSKVIVNVAGEVIAEYDGTITIV